MLQYLENMSVQNYQAVKCFKMQLNKTLLQNHLLLTYFLETRHKFLEP